MTDPDVLKRFQSENALLEGHFLLSSGLHSPRYLQCALVLQRPRVAEELCKALAAKLKAAGVQVDVLIGPAMGGITVAYELSRAVDNTRAMFSERVDGVFQLRRGFSLKPGEKVVIVEDVVTTGKSTRELIEVVHAAGARVTGVASLVDRTGGQSVFKEPFVPLVRVDVPAYKAEECPLCREGKIPLVKPGSRPQ